MTTSMPTSVVGPGGCVGADPCVSVIIPTYNHAHYLTQAVQSVFNQSYQDFEVIVVDDGSTDETPVTIASFGRRVRSIRQENRGLSAARNSGILAAKGEFIGLLDADDIWMLDYLETMIPALESGETVGAAYCGWRYVDATGAVLPRVNVRAIPPDQVHELMSFRSFLIPSGVLVRRECFERLGMFDESLRACEDWDMWLRILRNYRMVGVLRALVKYRVHGENMTTDLERMEVSRRAVIAKHFGREKGEPTMWPTSRRRAYGGFYADSALARFRQGSVEQGQRYVRRAFVVYPELAGDLDVFYELGCAHQPPGIQGVFEYLDLEQSAQSLFNSLEAVFDTDRIPPRLRERRSEAYGHAYLALGLLAYGCRRMAEARRYLLQAVRYHLPLVRHPQVLPKLLKSLLGPTLLGALRDYHTARMSGH